MKGGVSLGGRGKWGGGGKLARGGGGSWWG